MSPPQTNVITGSQIGLHLAGLTAPQRTLLDQRLLRARQTGPARPNPRPAITPHPPAEWIPLSHAQERLWFLDQLVPDRAIYNVYQAMRITGALNAPALEQALNELVERHDVFRTNFTAREDGPVQVVAASSPLVLAVADLAGLAPENRDRELALRLQAEAKRPFDLASDRLLRGLLVRLAPDEHVLMLVMHHIVSDGWSMGILFRELGVLHEAFSSGKPSPLPGLPIRFADYAWWERRTLRDEALEKPLVYWRRQLAGAATLELSTDHPRPAEPSFRGATVSRQLPAELLRDIRATSQREGVTMFMTLLAAFQAVLHRYTGQEDIVLGSCVAGRPQIELEKLAGFFVNTIVLRTSVADRPTFRDLLRRTRETVLGAMAHQDLPFERLVAELQPDRSLARNPFFQVMFVLQSATGAQPQSAGLGFEPLEFDNGTSKFDLSLSLAESAGGLHLSLEYGSDLFEPATINRLLEHYHTLLAAAVADPARRVSELPLLSAAERRQLLVDWSGNRRPYPRDATVVDLFREHVARDPVAPALLCLPLRLSYRELDERSSRLARHLRHHGAVPGSFVALCLERSPETAISLLAILKTGAAYVSLESNYPAARLAVMIEDSRPVVLLTQEKLRSLAESALAASHDDAACPLLVVLEEDRTEIDREPPTAPLAAITAESTAYVSYTSGSTGRPKGVCVPHRGVVRLVRGTDYLHFGPDETFLQFAPVAFDASTLEIWGALLNGARLAVVPPGLPSLAELGEFVRANGVTTAFFTTGLFHQMVDEQVEQLAGIRQLSAGGEVLSPVHAARALERLPHLRLVNGYGPTENTTFTTTFHVATAPAAGRPIPIGRPIANTTVYLLDSLRQLVPIGIPGELYTGGDGLAAGYLRRPDLDAGCFIPHPFDPAPGARLYRTGDLARWLPDGTIEFLGRADRQIKLRGFRLEPGEIESVLAKHPRVGQAAVLLDANGGGGPRLVGYVTGRGSVPPDLVELRAYLQKNLPDYMVPAVIMPVPQMPLNANGKVDHSALPAADAAPAAGRPPVVAPRDSTEARLVAIWEKILGVSPVGVHDSFFQLGGHSMAGVRLFARIEREFGRRLPLASLFESPTLEQLAVRLRDPAKPVTCSSLVALQPRGTRPPMFFVHGAGGGNLWTYTNLIPHLDPDQPVYAFESRGMRSHAEFTRVEDMARHYLQEIRTVQPQGPYYLGGYCFGGNVAFEMARQLEAAGEPVALLTLLDSAAANSCYQRLPWWQPVFHLRFAVNTAYWLADFLRQPSREQLRFVRRKCRVLAGRVLARLRGKGQAFEVEEVIDVSLFPEIELGLWQTHLRALGDYHPQPYGGRAVLFRTRGHPFLCSFDPRFGWGPLVRGGIETVILPGAHEGIFMEPHVRALSACFRQQLEKAQANA